MIIISDCHSRHRPIIYKLITAQSRNNIGKFTCHKQRMVNAERKFKIKTKLTGTSSLNVYCFIDKYFYSVLYFLDLNPGRNTSVSDGEEVTSAVKNTDVTILSCVRGCVTNCGFYI